MSSMKQAVSPLARGVALLVASAALGGCQLLALGLQAQSYPGEAWSASPLPPDPVLSAAAPELCGADYDIAAPDLRIAVQAQHSTHRAAFILRSADGMIDCVVERPPDGVPVTGGGGAYGSADVTPFEGALDLFLSGEAAGPPTSRAYGRAGPGIVGVRVNTTNSGTIKASMGEGWFLAMWPGVGQVVSVEGLDDAGGVVVTVPGLTVGEDDDWIHATPYPTLPDSLPEGMAAAVTAAEPFATELSQTPAVLSTVFPVELADYCSDGMCPGVSGRGWGVVFEITGPDGQIGTVLVVLDADGNLLLTQQ